LDYFDRLGGYDDEIVLEFALNFQNIMGQEYVIAVRGLKILINEFSISRVSNFLMGLTWEKQERQEATNEKNIFFHRNERSQEDKNDIKREILP
jgi:hypothetical protein